MADLDRQGIMEMFIFEMTQLVDQLEQHVVQSESEYSAESINEIFRIMHTIKGSAAMMMYNGIAEAAHTVEDLFFYIREQNPTNVDYSALTDHVLEAMDYIKAELSKISDGEESDGDPSAIAASIKDFLTSLKGDTLPASPDSPDSIDSPGSTDCPNRFSAVIWFQEGCEMENIRSYALIHNLGDKIFDYTTVPEDVIDESSIPHIRTNGFFLEFSTNLTYDEIYFELEKTIYLSKFSLKKLNTEAYDSEQEKSFKAVIRFTQKSENDKAYALVRHLEQKCAGITYKPVDIVSGSASKAIRKNGLEIEFTTRLTEKSIDEILKNFTGVREYELELTEQASEIAVQPNDEAIIGKAQGDNKAAVALSKNVNSDEIMGQYSSKNTGNTGSAVNAGSVENVENTGSDVNTGRTGSTENTGNTGSGSAQNTNSNEIPVKKAPVQHVISVNVSKLDQLLNLMGELVIAEAMVTQNPELEGLELESFHKETRQLRKIITDIQDTVMSMRMVPLSQTFFKMHRLVRDMCKSLDKDATLEILGEETEVDKNIIEHISDPLMHIIRNSVDHGIEPPEVRKKAGKPEKGTIWLEAKNAGGDVLIIISDDGQGLNKEAIMNKARTNGLLRKPENEYTDKEIYQFIFLPGFSTNEQVTSYSGRGVGMDVVSTNLEEVGGSVLVESCPGQGSVFTLKIPLTLAIIEGMTIKMGGAKYTIPIISIKESFKAKADQVFIDPNGNEMIQVRGEVYNVVRLYEFFGLDSSVQNIEDGIMIMLENGDQTVCLFADELIGEQQVVVKSMPKYIKKVHGISGCTLLGNGDISLIIDVAGFFDK